MISPLSSHTHTHIQRCRIRTITPTTTYTRIPTHASTRTSTQIYSQKPTQDNGDNEENELYSVPEGYELFDYANAEYSDQGDLDTFPSNSDKTELEIEEMREERRRKNDEFQFETFYKDFVGEEEEWRGEWTRYETTTFLPNEAAPQGGMPQLVKPIRSTKAITTALRSNPSGDKSTTHDYITQSEYHITDESADTSLRTTVTRDPSTNFGAKRTREMHGDNKTS